MKIKLKSLLLSFFLFFFFFEDDQILFGDSLLCHQWQGQDPEESGGEGGGRGDRDGEYM